MKKLKFMPHQKKSLDDTEPFNRVAYYLDMGLGKTFVGAEKLKVGKDYTDELFKKS